jgi:outer membrane murein-binding lipoprotein Lpp
MNEELIKIADKIRKGYSSVLEDEEEDKLSFLDELNALVRAILKDEPIDIYTLLTPEELKKWKKAKIKRRIRRLLSSFSIRGGLYFAFLSTITLFLVSEALPFYAVDGVISAKTYLKAILTELSFIFLSGYIGNTKLTTALSYVLRVAIFCLMLFVITSEVALEGTENISKINNLATRIERLEKQIDRTEKDIEKYRQMNWPRNMTQSIRKREKLEEQLQELKERQEKEGASTEVSKILEYKIYGKAFFRLILMMITVLITRRIFKF